MSERVVLRHAIGKLEIDAPGRLLKGLWVTQQQKSGGRILL